MAVVITADEQPVYPPRVLVSVTGLTLGNEVQVYRSVAGDLTALRGGYDAAVGDTAFLVTDAELPFGAPVTYDVYVNGASADTVGPTTYTLTGGKVAISDAITGLSAEVIILAWPELGYDRQGTVFRAGGRNVAVVGDLGMPTSTIELYTEAASSAEQVRQLLAEATEGIIQIRQPGGYTGVDSYQAVMGTAERRFSQDGSDDRRIWVLQLAEVQGWGETMDAGGYTLADLDAAYTGLTLADLSADFATLLALAQAEF